MDLKFNCACPNCKVDFSKLSVQYNNLTCVDKEGEDQPEMTIEGPQPGHIMICPFCSDVSIFTDSLELRPLTAKESACLSSPDWDNIRKDISDPYYKKEVH